VYVTDNVEGIVPEFLMMLKGVVDSPDIPLNVFSFRLCKQMLPLISTTSLVKLPIN
jgi:HSP90 family molecular chaperone